MFDFSCSIFHVLIFWFLNKTHGRSSNFFAHGKTDRAFCRGEMLIFATALRAPIQSEQNAREVLHFFAHGKTDRAFCRGEMLIFTKALRAPIQSEQNAREVHTFLWALLEPFGASWGPSGPSSHNKKEHVASTKRSGRSPGSLPYISLVPLGAILGLLGALWGHLRALKPYKERAFRFDQTLREISLSVNKK